MTSHQLHIRFDTSMLHLNTLLAAIRNGNLTTFPGLTVAHVMKLPESDETQKGHMKQIQQGLRSTKRTTTPPPSTPTPGTKHQDVYLHVYDATKKTMNTDQTGRFPVISQQGHKYLMVAVDFDGNYIDAECMKSHKTNNLIKAYQNIHQCWKDSQVTNKNWHVLDNETPRELKAAIRNNGCTVELTPLDIHRCNNAERAIQTFKSHFISILAGVDNSFPINEWDDLLPQTILTLNLLRNANVAPKISAYAYHHGPFDYDRMQLSPIGCTVQFYIKPGCAAPGANTPPMVGMSVPLLNTTKHIASL
eukprot:CCRYP_006012-RA/>CCRYP_006012-RA protein AED:0.40 eAED:0.40 QI:0/0/0/1/0/0/2/0/304